MIDIEQRVRISLLLLNIAVLVFLLITSFVTRKRKQKILAQMNHELLRMQESNDKIVIREQRNFRPLQICSEHEFNEYDLMGRKLRLNNFQELCRKGY